MIDEKTGEFFMCTIWTNEENSSTKVLELRDGNWIRDDGFPLSSAFHVSTEFKLKRVNKIKPRTKTVYEHLTESNTSVWGLKEMLDNEELFSRRSDGTYILYSSNAGCYMISHFIEYGVYRKVEKEIDWKDELAERAGLVYDKASDSFDMNGKYWDSNWVMEFGHLVASLTDKPE